MSVFFNIKCIWSRHSTADLSLTQILQHVMCTVPISSIYIFQGHSLVSTLEGRQWYWILGTCCYGLVDALISHLDQLFALFIYFTNKVCLVQISMKPIVIYSDVNYRLKYIRWKVSRKGNVMYQTRESMFHRDIQTLKTSWQCDTYPNILTKSEVFGQPMKHGLECLIYLLIFFKSKESTGK